MNRSPGPAAEYRSILFVGLLSFALVCALESEAVSETGRDSGVEYRVVAKGLSGPRGLLFTPSGDLLAVEQSGGTIVKILTDGSVIRLTKGFSAPHDLAIGASGDLYVADTGARRIARVSPDGRVSTYIDNLEEPVDLAIHPNGQLFVCELGAGRVTAYKTPRESRVVAEGLAGPHGLAFDGSGVTFVNEWSGNRLVKIDSRGRIERVAEVEDPVGIAIGRSGDLYVAQPQAGKVSRIKRDGRSIVLINGLDGPRDPAFDSAGNLYVAETGLGRILKITGDY